MSTGYDNSRAKDHVARYLADPENAYLIYPWDDGRGVPTLLLTTTGRRTGTLHTTPLIYGRVGGCYVVVASLGGAPRHPTWYLNLVDNPRCRIQVLRDEMPADARTATGEEWHDLWDLMVDVFPEYASFQQRTERHIPVVVLEP